MTVPVFAAVSGAAWEAALVAALEGDPNGATVVRRCVDLADLLAAAAGGTARAALVSADLRHLDRDALRRLAVARVAVVGLFTPGDDAAEARLRLLGVEQVLSAAATTQEIAATVIASVASAERGPVHSGANGGNGSSVSLSYGDPASALADLAAVSNTRDDETVVPGSGRLIAVWGPTGAPGRTTVTVGIAGELALARVPTLLADADIYGGSIAQVLGFLDEAPGLAAAARLANMGQLDLA